MSKILMCSTKKWNQVAIDFQLPIIDAIRKEQLNLKLVDAQSKVSFSSWFTEIKKKGQRKSGNYIAFP